MVNGIRYFKTPLTIHNQTGVQNDKYKMLKSLISILCHNKARLTEEQQVVNFMFSYRSISCTEASISSNEMILKVKPRRMLDLLKPKSVSVTFKKAVNYINPSVCMVGKKVLVGKLGPYTNNK